jgi:SNF2 family DNA or RNA helicase
VGSSQPAVGNGHWSVFNDCLLPTADCRPTAFSVDLRLEPGDAADDWNRLLQQSIAVGATTMPLKSAAPAAISIPIARTPIKVRSFDFPPPTENESPAAPPNDRGNTSAAIDSNKNTTSTRIHPPGDCIKLEDRLLYLLQPSLETLIGERSMEFPFHPFPYQFQGIAFLFPRHAAILADEMGLGKTMQAITAIRLLLRSAEVRSVLLICPKPLVTNWQREFQQWAPEIPLLTVEGDQERRAWQWQLADVPVRIANYELVCRDHALFESRGGDGCSPLHFDLVILDESQRIKNRASNTSEVVRSIHRGRSWAITGTPIENSPEDLVGIFEFLAPGFLNPEMKPRRMGQTIGDYVLRRTKDQVLKELPPKLFRDAELDLTPEQRESYQMAEEEGVLRLARLEQSLTIQHVFELVLRLKQICNFDPATGASSKLERLLADMEEVADSGRKAIVFSQWVETIQVLAEKLRPFGPLQYHGRIPSGRRDDVIRRFRDDPHSHVILMSYGAGGVGLNLQFANYVFLFDRWWNPAIEDQAINRAHRIGGSGPVTVTRFLMLQTIEQRIDSILQQKRELFDTVFSGAECQRHRGLTQAEIFGLFGVVSRPSAGGTRQ